MLCLQSNRSYYIPVSYVYINKRKKHVWTVFHKYNLVTITVFTYASKYRSLPYLVVLQLIYDEKEKGCQTDCDWHK